MAIWLFFPSPASANLGETAIISLNEETITPPGCEGIIEQFTADLDWYERLVNPILKTPQEVAERFDVYSQVHACLDDYTGPLPGNRLQIKTLVEYFLLFTEGVLEPEAESALVLADLKQSDDPAIQQIRDEAGIPPPEGKIFVRYYASREEMPALVRRAFENEDVAGVTILKRYVAILDEEKATWPQQALQNQTLPTTISHELVHAYLNSSPGSQAIGAPDWYHEGIAIYFSRSGEGHSIITPELTVSTTPPKEYQQYDNNFKYLEAKLGRKGLVEKIRISLEQADPAVLYRDLGIADEQELFERASTWQRQWIFIRAGVFVAVVVLILWIVISRMPEVRCVNCEYTGKKREFGSGVCPNCQRPYNIEVDY